MLSRSASHALFVSTLLVFQQRTMNNAHPESCTTYAKADAPAADQPTADERRQLTRCDPVKLYFGIDTPADPVSARKCAYINRETGAGDWINGPSVLAMIYANGRGVTRDLNLALKFACEVDGAPAENEGRVAHLEKLKRENWRGNDFHICDDITSGLMMGVCADLQETFDQAVRARRIETLIAKWTPAERAAFLPLQKAADAFFDASSGNEVDMSGTGRVAWAIEARAKLADGFGMALQRFEHGALPNFTAADFQSADAALNTRYQQLRVKKFEFGTVTFEDIQTAQRAWLQYRDAWVTFGKVKYPSVSADSWRTWLTRDRIEMWK